jgi:hypothetical protein
MTEDSVASVPVLFFLLRHLRHIKKTTAAMTRRKASEPPTAPPITAPETLLGLGATVGGDVEVCELLGTLLAVEKAVASGTVDDSATFRSWK